MRFIKQKKMQYRKVFIPYNLLVNNDKFVNAVVVGKIHKLRYMIRHPKSAIKHQIYEILRTRHVKTIYFKNYDKDNFLDVIKFIEEKYSDNIKSIVANSFKEYDSQEISNTNIKAPIGASYWGEINNIKLIKNPFMCHNMHLYTLNGKHFYVSRATNKFQYKLAKNNILKELL